MKVNLEQIRKLLTTTPEGGICALSEKWWKIDELLKLYDEDDLPGNMYEELYLERNRVEDIVMCSKPTNAEEVSAQLRLVGKLYHNTWGPPKGEEPCPIDVNILTTIENIISFMNHSDINIHSKKSLFNGHETTTDFSEILSPGNF